VVRCTCDAVMLCLAGCVICHAVPVICHVVRVICHAVPVICHVVRVICHAVRLSHTATKTLYQSVLKFGSAVTVECFKLKLLRRSDGRERVEFNESKLNCFLYVLKFLYKFNV
jgi:hypothetical protein